MLAKQVFLSIFQSLNILFKLSPFAAKEAGAKLCGLARVVVVVVEETDVSLADSQRRFSEAQENTQRSACCNQGREHFVK